MNSIFSVRLKQARIMRGLSMDALCDKVGNAITKQSISKYETGKMLPDSKILILLSKALEVSIDYFFRQQSVSIENVEFRKKSKLGVKQIDSIKEVVKDQLERYFEIENLNAIESSYRVQYGNVLVQDEDEAKHFCPNRDECPPQIKGKFIHFIGRKAMDINAGEATIEQLYGKGYIKQLSDLYKLTEVQLLTLDKWKEKSVANFLKSLEDSKKVPFHRLLFAIGISYTCAIRSKAFTSGS